MGSPCGTICHPPVTEHFQAVTFFESLSVTNTVQCSCGTVFFCDFGAVYGCSDLLAYLLSRHYVALQVWRQVPSTSRTVGGPWRKPGLADYRRRRRLSEWRNRVRWSVKETSTRRCAALCHRPSLSLCSIDTRHRGSARHRQKKRLDGHGPAGSDNIRTNVTDDKGRTRTNGMLVAQRATVEEVPDSDRRSVGWTWSNWT